ncbi:lipoprotein-releasing ABC transporter permease subunit [Asticcacaulis sp. EMRT-3]|uniref:lipoprotein-releasing ABC transporter permease subunit n=1 Tax=Asticcacaulis sp. EMRT-3 TaxID=3040349 RepID=UPI0024AF948D|nr:lipoprotein-releasing ABC transporter permease subunit [Asticcacaulis sp. EMRT-3]MDI7774852.1 lipoprotein-releasing ABC transporter permease subunit [Asticcacaulis sp. EMRT-3]
MNAVLSMFAFKRWEIDLAMRYLRTKRKDGGIAVIAIISFVGITLAVTALICVLSIMNGFRDELMSRTLAFGGHAYVGGQVIDDFAHRDDMLKRLKAVPGVTEATPLIDSPGLIESAHGETSLAYMRGVVPEDLKKTPIVSGTIEKGGSMAQFGVGDYGGNVVLVGDGLANELGLLPGDQVTLVSPGGSTAFGATPRRKVYTVGGVFKSGVSEIDKSFVYMPIQQAQLFFDREDEWDTVELKVDKPYDIESYLPALHQAAGQGAVIATWKEQNAPLWGALKVERNAMRFILFFIVIIAMLNIISGIVMLVKNKTRDVAILRTMGADRSAISRIFFLTGTTIGATGTFSGLLIGVLFCTFIRQIQDFLEWLFHTSLFNKDIYYLDHVPAKMEPSEVIFVVVASLLAASISTFFPALWASKLEPVEALRYE